MTPRARRIVDRSEAWPQSNRARAKPHRCRPVRRRGYGPGRALATQTPRYEPAPPAVTAIPSCGIDFHTTQELVRATGWRFESSSAPTNIRQLGTASLWVRLPASPMVGRAAETAVCATGRFPEIVVRASFLASGFRVLVSDPKMPNDEGFILVHYAGKQRFPIRHTCGCSSIFLESWLRALLR
jgi:hypothetical protein